MTEIVNTFGWSVGTRVVTRRGKRGTIVAVGADTVDVQFGGANGPIYTMKNGNVIVEREYDRMGKGYAKQYHGR